LIVKDGLDGVDAEKAVIYTSGFWSSPPTVGWLSRKNANVLSVRGKYQSPYHYSLLDSGRNAGGLSRLGSLLSIDVQAAVMSRNSL
jgi:hypothetical protein